jgi:hypothetical protein
MIFVRRIRHSERSTTEPRNPRHYWKRMSGVSFALQALSGRAPGPPPTVLGMTVSDSHNPGRRSHRQNQPMGRLIHQARALRSHQR